MAIGSYGIGISVSVVGMEQAIKAIADIEDFIKTETDEFSINAMHGAAKVFDRNFQSEGAEVGGWAQLREQTVQERRRKGFGGEHPILIRYGDLRQVTATDLIRARRTTLQKTDADGKVVRVTISTQGDSLNVVASGEKAGNQVRGNNREPRPYWFFNKNVGQEMKHEVMETIRVGIQRII